MVCIFLSAESFVFKLCVTYEDMRNSSVLLPFKRRSENLTQTWEGQDGLSQLARLVQEEIQMSKKRVCKFLGRLIFAIVSAMIVLTTASVAVAALTHSIQTAHNVGQALTNITKELRTQENIDKEIMARLDTLESALLWVGERVDAQKTRLSLHCDWEYIHNSLCVTPLPWNDTEQKWETVKNHLQGAFDKTL